MPRLLRQSYQDEFAKRSTNTSNTAPRDNSKTTKNPIKSPQSTTVKYEYILYISLNYTTDQKGSSSLEKQRRLPMKKNQT